MKFSIVTPCLNPGPLLERTIESVLSQKGAFDLDYFVVDGGSTDGTIELLRRNEGRLRWVSAPDGGQSEALNQGFATCDGEVHAWIGADDLYLPGAFDRVRQELESTGARWVFGQCRVVDAQDREIRRSVSRYKNRASRRYSWRELLARNFIPQPAVFFRRNLWEEAGPLRQELHLAMDYDLWLRFGRLCEPAFIPRDLAAFRWHARSKSGRRFAAMAREAYAIARSHAGPGDGPWLRRHRRHVLVLAAYYSLLDCIGR